MQADDRIPASLIRGRQVFDEACDFNALVVRHGRVGTQDFGQRRRSGWVVVFVRPGQADDEAARDFVRQAVHVVNLRRQQQLADVGKHRLRHEVACQFVLGTVHAGGDTAGVKTFNDFDELHHRFTQAGCGAWLETVGFGHERARADQQITKAGARRNAAVAMVRGVAVREHAGMLPFTGIKNALPGDKDLVKNDHACALAVTARKERRAMLNLVAWSPGWPRHDGDARRVNRHRATHRKCRVGLAHLATRCDEKLMHVGRARDDGLGAADDDAPRIAFNFMQVAVDVGLLVRATRPIALGVGHGNANGQVLVLHVAQVGGKTRTVFGAALGVVDACGDLRQSVQTVVRQVALRAARFLAQDANCFELVEQVACRFVDVQHARHMAACAGLIGHHQGGFGGIFGKVVAHAQGVDTGLQLRCVGHAADELAVHVDDGLQGAQGLSVVGTGQACGCGRGCRWDRHQGSLNIAMI